MKMKKFLCIFLSAALLWGVSGCNMSNTGKGAMIGTGGGAALGAGIGALFGKGKGAAIGAAVGAVAGGVAGTLIGKKMDKQAKELAQINGAQVDTLTDQNGLTAIKVTFDQGILFATGKSNLSASAKNSLNEFATSLQNNPQTNVQIYGHTDNTGSLAVNQRLSKERALSVLNYLNNAGVARNRMVSDGFDYQFPVASNDTEAGRAQNRRVEVYISANEQMIEAANNGTLQ
ncbi:MAG: OmpA family protein [Muribaculaceae bacterium]|nr:OmpA family protein [Muribaculaceae bacterium]